MTRVLVVDNYDSFVFTLVAYLRELGAEVEVVQGAEVETREVLERARGSQGVVISPGPGRPEEVLASLALVEQAVARSQPLLGICLGHQVLAHAFGGRVSEAPELLHGRTSAVLHDADPLFTGLDSGFTAMRYHSLAVEAASLPPELAVIAMTADSVVMGLRHRGAPVVGVQFHPESVLTEGGHRLLANWLDDVRTPGSRRMLAASVR